MAARLGAVEARLQDAVLKRWQTLQKDCLACDTGYTGALPAPMFKQVCLGVGIPMSEKDLNVLVWKYGDRKTQTVNYNRFLQYFVQAKSARVQTRPSTAANGNNQHGELGTRALAGAVSEEGLAQLAAAWRDIRRDLKRLEQDHSAGAKSARGGDRGLVGREAMQAVLDYYQVDIQLKDLAPGGGGAAAAPFFVATGGGGSGGRVRYDALLRHLLASSSNGGGGRGGGQGGWGRRSGRRALAVGDEEAGGEEYDLLNATL